MGGSLRATATFLLFCYHDVNYVIFKKVTFYIMAFENVNRLCALTVFMSHCCLAFRWVAASRRDELNEGIALVGVLDKVKSTELTDLRYPTSS